MPLPTQLGAPRAPSGKALIGASLSGVYFKNLMMGASDWHVTNADISKLDVNGYPTSVPASNVFLNVLAFPSNLSASEVFVIKWTGKADLQLARGAPGFTVVSDPSTVVNGGTGSNLRVTTSVNASYRVTFQFVTSVPSSVTFNFMSGGAGTFDGSLSNLVICRLSDETALSNVTKPGDYFSDDYVNAYRALNFGVFRPMGWTNPNFGNVSQSKYIPAYQTSMNCCSERWAPGAYAGNTSGTNTYTCSAQPDATGSYVNGETIHAIFVNGSTSTPITLNSNSRGAKQLYNYLGVALASGDIPAGTAATLTYDSVLNGFRYQAGPLTACMPYELQVGFANRINAHYWCNFPHDFDDTSVTAVTTIVKNNLDANKTAYFEYSNEVWNTGFPQAHTADARGLAMGFTGTSLRSQYGWYALRVVMMMNLVAAAWSPRTTTQLRRVMAFQAYAGTNVATNKTYKFEGADLAPSGVHTGQGNSVYNTFTGSADYTQSPNRPIDVCETLSYATYYSGGETLQFDQNYLDYHTAGLNFNALTNAADQYAAGSVTTALNWLDNDIRTGTLSDSTPGFFTLLDFKTGDNIGSGAIGIYPSWEACAVTYSSGRGTPVTVECYEGGESCVAPSTGTCTTIGISTAYGGAGGKIDNLIQAYRASDLFKATVIQQYNDFMASAHSVTPGWLQVQGPNAWSLTRGDVYAGHYTSWDANVSYNN